MRKEDRCPKDGVVETRFTRSGYEQVLYCGFFVTKITPHREVTKVAVRMYSSYLSQPIIYIGMDKKCRSDEQLECS